MRELWERHLRGGYTLDPADALEKGFEEPQDDMVVVRDIAHVAYIPGGRLHGFGCIARMVDAINHRFTTRSG